MALCIRQGQTHRTGKQMDAKVGNFDSNKYIMCRREYHAMLYHTDQDQNKRENKRHNKAQDGFKGISLFL